LDKNLVGGLKGRGPGGGGRGEKEGVKRG